MRDHYQVFNRSFFKLTFAKGKNTDSWAIATESGVDSSVENKFPGAQVTYGSAASGAGNNRDIPLSEGGDINPKTGQYVSCLQMLLLDRKY